MQTCFGKANVLLEGYNQSQEETIATAFGKAVTILN